MNVLEMKSPKSIIIFLCLAVAFISACGGGSASGSGATTLRPVTILASGLNYPSTFVVDSTCVYWMEYDYVTYSGSIRKISIDGGMMTTIASVDWFPGSLAVDSDYVYWIEYSGESHGSWSTAVVKKTGLNGGDIATLASTHNSTTGDIIVDSTDVYWSMQHPYQSSQSIYKVGKDGGTADGIVSTGSGIASIAVDATDVYWAEEQSIQKISKNGGTSALLVQAMPSDMVIDDTYIYWTDYVYGTVSKMKKSGGTTTVLASHLDSPGTLAVYASNVYWIEQMGSGAREIRTVGTDGGEVTTLVSNLDYAEYIAVDASSIYWIEPGNGTLNKISR